jgi:hypothetical protein
MIAVSQYLQRSVPMRAAFAMPMKGTLMGL